MINFNRWVVIVAALLVFTNATAHITPPPEPYIPEEAIVIVAKPKPLVLKAIVTGYNSLPNQTDSTPFETATGDSVFYGGIAVSRPLLAEHLLPYGSIVTIEGQVDTFIVNDTMNKRFDEYKVDIWLPHYKDAMKLGAKTRMITKIGQVPRKMIYQFVAKILPHMGTEKVRI